MFCHKKSVAREINKEDSEPIDFVWMLYIGMNKLGFTYKQVRHMYFGLWTDLFEVHKRQYNFEMQKALYDIQVEEEISSLSVL